MCDFRLHFNFQTNVYAKSSINFVKKLANNQLLCKHDLFIQKIMYKNVVNRPIYIKYSKKGIFINK